jgi:hypothetical protein
MAPENIVARYNMLLIAPVEKSRGCGGAGSFMTEACLLHEHQAVGVGKRQRSQ